MQTAEELISEIEKVFYEDAPLSLGTAIEIEYVSYLMKKYAIMHVEAALIAANENWEFIDGCDTHGVDIKKDSILNAYNFDNIK